MTKLNNNKSRNPYTDEKIQTDQMEELLMVTRSIKCSRCMNYSHILLQITRCRGVIQWWYVRCQLRPGTPFLGSLNFVSKLSNEYAKVNKIRYAEIFFSVLIVLWTANFCLPFSGVYGERQYEELGRTLDQEWRDRGSISGPLLVSWVAWRNS